eukprot:12206369-Alexandrium_andersonii.AAC.1
MQDASISKDHVLGAKITLIGEAGHEVRRSGATQSFPQDPNIPARRGNAIHEGEQNGQRVFTPGRGSPRGPRARKRDRGGDTPPRKAFRHA